MSVLIKGMEMQKSCSVCKLFGEYGCPFVGAVGYALTRGERNDDCPLVPVPPHGRLIDADALRQSIKESIDECNKWADEVEGGEMYARVSQSLGTFVECSLRVKAAPTIIPADPAKEETE